jgi:hypothetical protein
MRIVVKVRSSTLELEYTCAIVQINGSTPSLVHILKH